MIARIALFIWPFKSFEPIGRFRTTPTPFALDHFDHGIELLQGFYVPKAKYCKMPPRREPQ
jgi:hypothetical protein